jgi:AraC-like DNA-binding protein
MMMNCCTLAEASEKSGRYERIIGTMIQGGVRFGLGTVTFLLSQPKHAPAMSRHCFESAMSGIVRMMRTLAGREIDPLEIRFSYPRPASTAEYERVFRCPVHFGRKATSITLPSGYGDLPVAASNPGLLAYFEDYAKRFLDGIDAKERYGRLVTKAILAHLDDESLSIRLVAKDLAMSPRTLQSRLKAEGRGFSELLDDTRHALARRYLRERQSVEDITYMLGFSEPSAFRKAFKKWSGLTPKEYRESMAETV